MDSNHRRRCQQIYSLSPLATREFPHIRCCCASLDRLTLDGGAGRRTRTPDLLITNQLLYQLSYTSTARTSKAYYSGKGVICQVLFFVFPHFLQNSAVISQREFSAGRVARASRGSEVWNWLSEAKWDCPRLQGRPLEIITRWFRENSRAREMISLREQSLASRCSVQIGEQLCADPHRDDFGLLAVSPLWYYKNRIVHGQTSQILYHDYTTSA